jgi:hypothetical protein
MGLRGWEEGEAAEEGTAAVLSHGIIARLGRYRDSWIPGNVKHSDQLMPPQDTVTLLPPATVSLSQHSAERATPDAQH